MKQVIQNLASGEVVVLDVPAPLPAPGQVLVATRASLVSAGTERMIVDFAQKNLLDKARSRPDLVKQMWEKAQMQGLLTTWEAARNRLEQPMPLGYSSAGVVIAAGAGVEGFQPGDRVACAGGGYAVHAEIVTVPVNLLTPLPDGIAFETAAFTTLGAIALQGIRLAEVRLGEVAAVIGLGLLGQMTCQMLRASGCRVVGMDIQQSRVVLAKKLGLEAGTTSAEELDALCRALSGGHGADAVLITADTKSNQPVELAGQIARDKGVVVAVGAVGLTLPRKVYYEKELDFRISRSYGPGRYDHSYEEEGRDYPYSYVRWTEGRNMAAFAQMVAAGAVDVASLISHRFPLDEAPRAYELITGQRPEPYLGVVLTYPEAPLPAASERPARLISLATAPSPSPAPVPAVKVGVLGAGNFANATLLPAIKGLPGLELAGIASRGGLSARTSADRFGFGFCASDETELLQHPAINTVAILTRHDQHARQTVAALAAGKHVFVEKPLCLSFDELEQIRQAHEAAAGKPMLMVGFNRRFAPFAVALKAALAAVREPLVVHYRFNAGYLPPGHWVHDPAQGGGRLLAEACHALDLLFYLADSPVSQVMAQAAPDADRYRQDNLSLSLTFANGSLGVVHYLANGSRRMSKERLEVFGGGLSAVLDDFRLLELYRGSSRSVQRARLRQDKGHRAEWEAIIAHLTAGGPAPIPVPDIFHSTRVALSAQQSLLLGQPVAIPPTAH